MEFTKKCTKNKWKNNKKSIKIIKYEKNLIKNKKIFYSDKLIKYSFMKNQIKFI